MDWWALVGLTSYNTAEDLAVVVELVAIEVKIVGAGPVVAAFGHWASGLVGS